ncbi:MAG: hypothetical protein FJ319_01850 [SAR202 cluster bacterium]|nr:hypothetical protein [SAR202 cluster bacterium]
MEALAASVTGQWKEVGEARPTVNVPGQDNFIVWTPRGGGIVMVDEGASPEALAGMLFGTIVAGNGAVVCVPSHLRALAGLLVDALHEAGVSQYALFLAEADATPDSLAALPVHFAVADLGAEGTASLHRALSVTSEDGGQRWLKALVSMSDGTRPGEPCFLWRLCHAKTVAVSTLRHGADLDLL